MGKPAWLSICLLGLTVWAVAACAGNEAQVDETLPPTATPTLPPAATTSPADRASRAEAQFLPRLEPALADLIRSQPWFESMKTEHLALIGRIAETEDAAGARGEKQSVAAAFEFASRQPWYTDGFDADEATGLEGVFQTYSASLADKRAPQIGPYLASTIEHQLTASLELDESGTIVVLVSSEDPELGRQALQQAQFWLPQVEQITGAFPYGFLHISLTELPELLAGLSNDEFIAISVDYVEDATMVHELSHSTLYGIFPVWFEEGFAYYLEYLLTADIEGGVQRFRDELAFLGVDTRLDLGPHRNDEYQYYIDQARGFLFINGLVDVSGIDAVVATVQALRTKTFTDQQLLKQLTETDDPALEAVLRGYVCEQVTGTIHDYCSQSNRFDRDPTP